MEDEDQKAIVARRARYIAMALAGVGTATQAAACVCLSPIQDVDAGDPTIDGGLDGGSDAGVDALQLDARPCLSLDAWLADDAQAADDVATPNDAGLDTANEDAATRDANEDAP